MTDQPICWPAGPSVSTRPEDIEARCRHLDHCAHYGKREDAARMMALISERDLLCDQLAAAEENNKRLREALEEINERQKMLGRGGCSIARAALEGE